MIGESSSGGLYWPMEYYDSDTDKMHQYWLAGTTNPIWTTFGKNHYVFNDGGIEGWRIGDNNSLADGSYYFRGTLSLYGIYIPNGTSKYFYNYFLTIK